MELSRTSTRDIPACLYVVYHRRVNQAFSIYVPRHPKMENDCYDSRIELQELSLTRHSLAMTGYHGIKCVADELLAFLLARIADKVILCKDPAQRDRRANRR